MSQSPAQIAAYAKRRYAGQVLIRVLLYAREATLMNLTNPNARPKSVVINVQGHPGIGKTAVLEHLARNEDLSYQRVDVGGVIDVAEIFGMANINPETGFSEFAKPYWWPRPGTAGILNIDDITRAHPNALQALQQFVIERSFGNLTLPDEWTIATTSNPDDGNNQVNEMDSAFDTRMITLAYNRPIEVYYEQLDRQNVSDRAANFWRANQEMKKARPITPKPVMDATANDRYTMLFNHMEHFLFHDEEALMLVASNMFGKEWATSYIAYAKADDHPISPEQILDQWGPAMAKKATDQFKKGFNDLLKLSGDRLLTRMKLMAVITPKQWDNIAAFMLVMPNDSGAGLFIDMCKKGKHPKSDLWRAELEQRPDVTDKFRAVLARLSEEA